MKLKDLNNFVSSDSLLYDNNCKYGLIGKLEDYYEEFKNCKVLSIFAERYILNISIDTPIEFQLKRCMKCEDTFCKELTIKLLNKNQNTEVE